MLIQSQRAKEIDTYLSQHTDAKVSDWPIVISGGPQLLPYYYFPVNLLQYNVHNGRLAVEVMDWETKNKRKLDPSDGGDAAIIHDMLLNLDPKKSQSLMEDLRRYKQEQPGAISHDGIVINGNRRLAVFTELHKEDPSGIWQRFKAVRLPPSISEQDLWKVEAGLQLSKDKVEKYGPVNELLKIKEGVADGLSVDEIAAVMYEWEPDDVRKSLERLELIDNFLLFIGQPGNYGLIVAFGYHEHFIDIQDRVIKAARRNCLPKREVLNQLVAVWALLRADIHLRKDPTYKKPVTHWMMRDLGEIFADARAKGAFLEHLGAVKTMLEVDPKVVIEDFRAAREELDIKEERGLPLKLIDRAAKALQGIDRKSPHFRGDAVRDAMRKLSEYVAGMVDELSRAG